MFLVAVRIGLNWSDLTDLNSNTNGVELVYWWWVWISWIETISVGLGDGSSWKNIFGWVVRIRLIQLIFSSALWCLSWILKGMCGMIYENWYQVTWAEIEPRLCGASSENACLVWFYRVGVGWVGQSFHANSVSLFSCWIDAFHNWVGLSLSWTNRVLFNLVFYRLGLSCW